MKLLFRVSLIVVTLAAGVPVVANAADADKAAIATPQDNTASWTNG